MLLHTAILSSPHLCQEMEYNKYAKDLLILFVEQRKFLYVEWFICYNVHCLIHLADDVIRFGALYRYSSLIFENNMKTMKAMVRKHDCVLAQIDRRMRDEETNLIHSNQMVTGKTILKIKHTRGPILSTGAGKKFKEIHFKSMALKCNDTNSCVILEDESLVKFSNIIEHNNSVVIVGQQLNWQKTDLFAKPLQSSRLDIYSVNNSAIKCKALCIPYS